MSQGREFDWRGEDMSTCDFNNVTVVQSSEIGSNSAISPVLAGLSQFLKEGQGVATSQKEINDILPASPEIPFLGIKKMAETTMEIKISNKKQENNARRINSDDETASEMSEILCSMSQFVKASEPTPVSTDSTKTKVKQATKVKDTNGSSDSIKTAQSQMSQSSTDSDKYTQKHKQEVAVIQRAERNLEQAQLVFNQTQHQHGQGAIEVAKKTLKTLQPLLTKLSDSHRTERESLTTQLANKLKKSRKDWLVKQGQLLQERQKQLLAVFEKHMKLSLAVDKLNEERKKVNEDSCTQEAPLRADLTTPRTQSVSVVNVQDMPSTQSVSVVNVHNMPSTQSVCVLTVHDTPINNQPIPNKKRKLEDENLAIVTNTAVECTKVSLQNAAGVSKDSTSKNTQCTRPVADMGGISDNSKGMKPVAGKRPVPQTVIDASLMMSPGSSLDLPVISRKPPTIKKPTKPVELPGACFEGMRTNSVMLPADRINRENTVRNTQPLNHPHPCPSLKDLIAAKVIEPGRNVLSLHTVTKTVFGNLTAGGLITALGDTFRSPMSWCSAVFNTGSVKKNVSKKTAYQKIHYLGKPLAECKLPQIISIHGNNTQMTSNLITAVAQQSEPTIKAVQSSTTSKDLFINFTKCRIISDAELLPNKTLPLNFWDSTFMKTDPCCIDMIEDIDSW